MAPASDYDVIGEGLVDLGIQPTGEVQGKLFAYLTELLLWQKKINLVSNPGDVVPRHIIDSLAPLSRIEEQLAADATARPRFVDLGSGGGFPGMVLAIARPEWQFSLVESSRRKCSFLLSVVSLLRLPNVRVVQAAWQEHTPPSDYVVLRAFARLDQDFWKTLVGKIPDFRAVFAWKGRRSLAEAEAAELEGEATDCAVEVADVCVPGETAERSLIVIRRV